MKYKVTKWIDGDPGRLLPGMVVQTKDRQSGEIDTYLVGDINTERGFCGCGFAPDEIVRYGYLKELDSCGDSSGNCAQGAEKDLELSGSH